MISGETVCLNEKAQGKSDHFLKSFECSGGKKTIEKQMKS